MENKTKILAAGAAFLLTAGVAISGYLYSGRRAAAAEETKEAAPSTPKADLPVVEESKEEEVAPADVATCPNWLGIEDPDYSKQQYLSKIEAAARSELISDVNYVLSLGLVKGGQTFHGKVTIDYTLLKIGEAFNAEAGADNSKCFFIDYKGKTLRSIVVNGQKLAEDTPNMWQNHRINIPIANQVVGKNKCVIEFETFFVTDCQGFQHFKDETDQSEYIYTELEPDYCHIVFPCFDQPDLKATYKTCIVAADDWEVITNSERLSVTKSGKATEDNQELKRVMTRAGVPMDSPILTSFGNTAVKVHDFTRTKKISTYLFCIVAGPFDFLEPSEELKQQLPHFPMRVYCRKSLTKYAQKMSDDFFRITKASIRYYEKLFNTPYPFDKLDSVFCPDYAMGAMENVGCITYNDDYIERDEHFTRYKKENIFNTVAHEISHQWFGNLVTMKWWDDLWLNESFANTVSYMAMDEAEGMEDCTLAWNIFIDEQFWGLNEDQKNTSHPIACEVVHTGKAQDIFDGISYGKGASFLHQMIFLLGKDLLKEGLKTYFAKYSYKNTTLKQFIAELSAAAKRMNIDIDFDAWSDSWLTKAGCSSLRLDYDRDEATGVLSNLKLIQTPHNMQNTPENRLRRQAINIASLDEHMKVIAVKRVETSDSQAETAITDAFVGQQDKKVCAFLINYECHGYAKFETDEMTMSKLENDWHKIENSRERKSIMNIMYDQVKSSKLPASRVLRVCINNLEHETAVDVIQDAFRFVVPSILSRFLHEEAQDVRKSELLQMVMRILQSGRFSDNLAAMELLTNSAISFAAQKEEHLMVCKWFVDGKITGTDGAEIAGTNVNVQMRHTMVRKMFASKHIPRDQSKQCFAQLKEMDKTDMMQRTQWYCEAAVPDLESKREAFNRLFNSIEEGQNLGLQECQEMCRGYAQASQKDILAQFADDFFERIENFVDKAPWSHCRYIYLFCQPKLNATSVERERFQRLLTKVEGYTEAQRNGGSGRLTNYLKDSLQELDEMSAGRELSRTWEANQASL